MIKLFAAVIATLCLSGEAFGQDHGLPLNHGTYGRVGANCRSLPAADTVTFSGGYVLQSADSACTATRARAASSRDYVVSMTCSNAQGGIRQSLRLTDRIHVLSQTEAVVANRFGTFHYRFCHVG